MTPDMRVGRRLLLRDLGRALVDSGIGPSNVVAFLLKARCPRWAAAAGYLPPGQPDRPHVALDPFIFRRIQPEIVFAHPDRHRIAVWASVPRLPFAFLGLLLRHELEHAAQYERFGKPLFELNAALREAWASATGRDHYGKLPVERQANLAAARYAGEHLEMDVLRRLRRDRYYQQLVGSDGEALEDDVLATTVTELRAALDAGAQLAQPFAAGELDDLEYRARTWSVVLGEATHGAPGIVIARPGRR
jgi:hypothetical protein